MRRTDENPRPQRRDPDAGLLGQSPAIQTLRRQIARVGPTEATVLILGERGTGKELVARALHAANARHGRTCVTVNCAALPPALLAGELFGHERGAFTGAHERRVGLLVAADGGTLLLDEIGDLAPEGQAMLLRFLQEGEVRPLGATRAVRVDVRVLAATNRDLAGEVAAGRFRADLLDRLAEVVLAVPPLRARGDDVGRLAQHFLAVQARRHGVRVRGLTPAAWARVRTYAWPGNVRELEQALSRGVILSERGWVDVAHLGLAGVRAQAGAAGQAHDGIAGRLADGDTVRPGDLATERAGTHGPLATSDAVGPADLATEQAGIHGPLVTGDAVGLGDPATAHAADGPSQPASASGPGGAPGHGEFTGWAPARGPREAHGPGVSLREIASMSSGAALTPRQREAVRLAAATGRVRRCDLVRRFGISGETARRDLAALVRLGWLDRTGRRRTTCYRPASPVRHEDTTSHPDGPATGPVHTRRH